MNDFGGSPAPPDAIADLGLAPDNLHIAVINNMPDGALKTTERQFLALLNLAAVDWPVVVSFCTLAGVPRADTGQRYIAGRYSSVGSLLKCRIDGLIVTGAEPRTPELTEESYWPSLAAVIDWAEYNTTSTIWSCLAAHAAVLRVDGIRRRRLREKRFGVFEYSRTSDHFLAAGMAPEVRVPHSRWNDLSARELEDSGYSFLTSSNEGADAFFRQTRTLSVFFQGHPEYEADTLLLEFRRDFGRFLRGERDCPSVPRGYFDQETERRLEALLSRSGSDRRDELLVDIPETVQQTIARQWEPIAITFYGNWLRYLSEEKQRQKRGEARWTRAASIGISTATIPGKPG